MKNKIKNLLLQKKWRKQKYISYFENLDEITQAFL